MASYHFFLQKRPSRNKKFDVYLHINVAGERKKMKTGVQVASIDHFNIDTTTDTWIRKSVHNSAALNEKLAVFLEKAKKAYDDVESKGEVTVGSVTKAMKSEKVSPSFMKFAKEQTQMIYDTGGFRNWKKHNSLMNKLDAFRKKYKMSDIRIEDLSYDFLTKFETFLLSCKNERLPERTLNVNTVEVHLTVMRALINKAIRADLMDASRSPFVKFRIKHLGTMKNKLIPSEIDKISELELEQGSLLWHCKNYFLFSFYCAGIRAGDLIQLRWRNITPDDRLEYQMGKTHKDRNLKLVPQALKIISYYRTGNEKPDDYIFPLLKNDAPYAKYVTLAEQDTMDPNLRKKHYADISSKNAEINKYLKKIATLAGIDKKLTMHISRHSFAHIAQDAGIESASVKNLLGHSKLSVTEKYMGSFDMKKSDKDLHTLFQHKGVTTDPVSDSGDVELIKEKAAELMSGLSPEEIMEVLGRLTDKKKS